MSGYVHDSVPGVNDKPRGKVTGKDETRLGREKLIRRLVVKSTSQSGLFVKTFVNFYTSVFVVLPCDGPSSEGEQTHFPISAYTRQV